MAKSVTFTDLETPSSLTATAAAGGALAANTTYYYKVIAVYDTGTTSYQYKGKSLASNEASATTTTTNKTINLAWTHTKDAGGGYRIFRRTTAAYTTALSECPTNATNNTANSCTWTNAALAVGGNTVYQDISHGKLVLAGSTVSLLFSIVDLYNADVTGGWGVVTRLDADSYKVDAEIVGHADLYWADTDKSIILGSGWQAGATSNYKFGTITNGITDGGCHLMWKTPNLETFNPITLNAYKTIFDYVPGTGRLNLGSVTLVAGTIQDCQVNTLRGFGSLSSTGTNVFYTNCIFSQYDSLFGSGKATYSNVNCMSGSRVFQLAGSANIRAKNLVVVGAQTLGVVYITGNNTLTLVNTNPTTPTYTAFSSGATGSTVHELFTYNLKVMQNDGITAISGATVKIYDVFNNSICNTTTDASGNIAEQELVYSRSTWSGLTRTDTKYAPHKLIITATGYETYTEYTDYTGSYLTNKTVSLKVIVPMRQRTRGVPLPAINPELGSSAILLG